MKKINILEIILIKEDSQIIYVFPKETVDKLKINFLNLFLTLCRLLPLKISRFTVYNPTIFKKKSIYILRNFKFLTFSLPKKSSLHIIIKT